MKIICGDCSTLFVKNGKAYACGDNYHGELGIDIGVDDDYNEIQLVNPLKKMKIVNISTGYHSSIFLTNNGKVYGCGSNSYGQLGFGDNDNRESPKLISALKDNKCIERM